MRERLLGVGLVTLVLGVAGHVAFDHAGPADVDRPAPRRLVETGPRAPAGTPLAETVMPVDSRQLAEAFERALLARDSGQRDTALGVLLPTLLREDAPGAARSFGRLPPGESRDAALEAMARAWVVLDSEGASAWMESLDEHERRSAAGVAMRALAATSPPRAIGFAARFGLGHDDGSLEHLVQIWAAEDPAAARTWVDSQPASGWTDRLRARVTSESAPAHDVSGI